MTLKANSFSQWREHFPETWDWKPLVKQHELLQAKVEHAAALPLSLKPVIREEFRSGAKGEDEAFAELSKLQDVCQVLTLMHDSLEPRERTAEIAFRIGDVLYHEGYGWQGVILGWDRQCRMPLEWVANNAKEKDQKWIDHLYRNPWYDILCNDGMLRYGSQMTHRKETKAFEFKPEIKRAPEIGQVFLDLHFDDFDETDNRFVPTPALAKRFPDKAPGNGEES